MFIDPGTIVRQGFGIGKKIRYKGDRPQPPTLEALGLSRLQLDKKF